MCEEQGCDRSREQRRRSPFEVADKLGQECGRHYGRQRKGRDAVQDNAPVQPDPSGCRVLLGGWEFRRVVVGVWNQLLQEVVPVNVALACVATRHPGVARSERREEHDRGQKQGREGSQWMGLH